MLLPFPYDRKAQGIAATQVFGIASEDMDSLTFATPILIRNLMKPQSQNQPINEYDYDKVLTCSYLPMTCGSTGLSQASRQKLLVCR